MLHGCFHHWQWRFWHSVNATLFCVYFGNFVLLLLHFTDWSISCTITLLSVPLATCKPDFYLIIYHQSIYSWDDRWWIPFILRIQIELGKLQSHNSNSVKDTRGTLGNYIVLPSVRQSILRWPLKHCRITISCALDSQLLRCIICLGGDEILIPIIYNSSRLRTSPKDT